MYVSGSDLIERFGEAEIKNLEQEGQNFNAALMDTDAMINGYISRVYSLPLKKVPSLLTGIAADIARYKIRSRSQNGRSIVSEDVRKRYEDALKLLQDIGKGLVYLDTGNEIVIPEASDNNVKILNSARIFSTKTGLKGYL